MIFDERSYYQNIPDICQTNCSQTTGGQEGKINFNAALAGYKTWRSSNDLGCKKGVRRESGVGVFNS